MNHGVLTTLVTVKGPHTGDGPRNALLQHLEENTFSQAVNDTVDTRGPTFSENVTEKTRTGIGEVKNEKSVNPKQLQDMTDGLDDRFGFQNARHSNSSVLVSFGVTMHCLI